MFWVQKYRLKSLNRELFSIVNLNKSDTLQEQLLNEVHSWNWTITNNDHDCRGQPPLSSKKGCVVNRWKSDSVIPKEMYLLLLRPVSLLFPRRSIYFSFVPFLYMWQHGQTALFPGLRDCLQGLCIGNKAGKCLVARFETYSWSKGHLVCRHAFVEVTWGQSLHQDQVRLDLGSMWCLCLMWSPSPNRFVLCGCPHIWPPRIIINIYICMCFWEFQLY